ncbi:Cdk-activating kinase assembly factor MAT1 centre domain-containing protein [Plasmodiophora brassicae]|uniref:MAT1 centre domain-containing protein n=1 Tax=Plasmodiophora brassicae TaxID=37360 RepID=A0A0G4J093_PLABS|nr:hypothetical protein PBRA_008244 [Plasmodiophora brassicae]SPR00971.1 unnamed protein product [Plasmodiophora brassicae]
MGPGPDASAADDDIDQVCAECRTSRALVPDIQLRYTTCCGACVCVECISGKFRRGRSVPCWGCQRPVTKTSFDARTFAQQKYENEARYRKLTDDTFHALSRDDFPSDEAYNDHLEMVEDILFDLTYGDPDQVAQAERRIAQFKTDHADRLTARMTARIAEQNLAEDAANAGPAPDHARTPVEPGVVHGLSKAAVSTIPPPKLLLVQPSIALDQVDTSNMTSSQLRAHKYALWQRKIAAARAAGFRKEICEARYTQEAYNGLFTFH